MHRSRAAARITLLASAAAVVLLTACGDGPGEEDGAPDATGDRVSFSLSTEEQTSGTDVLLQAVSAVDENVAWVSGHGGRWLRTEDAGETWNVGGVDGADSLEFRDVDAVNATRAWLLSAGSGPLSRIYGTADGGATWTLQYTADHPDAFLNCMGFWDEQRGLAYGDAVDGELFVLRTEDGGATWARVSPDSLPPAQEGEGGFAASGSCVATAPGGRAWIGTGNGERARVLQTSDWGRTWTSTDVPVDAGPGAGITAVGILEHYGFALAQTASGGAGERVAVTIDGGATWHDQPEPVMSGSVYGASFVPGMPNPTIFAVGPTGIDWSPDLGRSWRSLVTEPYWAVDFVGPEAGWAVGPEGRIRRYRFVSG